MGRTVRTEPQCLYKGALYLFYTYTNILPFIYLLEDPMQVQFCARQN